MVPAPRYDSFDDLNAHLEAKCLARQGETLRGHGKTIGERLMSDLDALMGLPVAEYEACDHVSTRATSISMVRYPLPGRVMQNMIPGGAAMITLCRWRMRITKSTYAALCMRSSLAAAMK